MPMRVLCFQISTSCREALAHTLGEHPGQLVGGLLVEALSGLFDDDYLLQHVPPLAHRGSGS